MYDANVPVVINTGKFIKLGQEGTESPYIYEKKPVKELYSFETPTYDEDKQLRREPISLPQIEDIELGVEKVSVSTSYSESYTRFNTQSLINSLDEQLSKWEEVGTDDALLYINEIKLLLEKNIEYLEEDDENRILLSLLELIFQNNNWEDFTEKEIKYLRIELKRFQEGEVTPFSLVNFSKQLYRKKISVLKNYRNEQKKKTE